MQASDTNMIVKYCQTSSLEIRLLPSTQPSVASPNLNSCRIVPPLTGRRLMTGLKRVGAVIRPILTQVRCISRKTCLAEVAVMTMMACHRIDR